MTTICNVSMLDPQALTQCIESKRARRLAEKRHRHHHRLRPRPDRQFAFRGVGIGTIGRGYPRDQISRRAGRIRPLFRKQSQQLSGEHGREVEVEYHIAPDWKLGSSTSRTGSKGIDLIWHSAIDECSQRGLAQIG